MGFEIRVCENSDLDALHAVINDGALAYHGIIPADCWSDPYMSFAHLQREIDDGVCFYSALRENELLGIMGIQDRGEVMLIRHAYVRTAQQRAGIGAQLLSYLRAKTVKPMLVGTWSSATWAIRFYAKFGFRHVSMQERTRLLKLYWRIPERQVETSVVLADPAWFSQCGENRYV